MRFATIEAARRHVWRCLATTLANDAHGLGAGHLNEDDFDEFDRRRLAVAVAQVLLTIRRRAKEPG